jgi:glycosyltransferase involved in cell wall biosynthesis
MDLTLLIPLLNEKESLPELHNWIKKVMAEHGYSHEIIFIDDGSTDGSWELICSIAKSDPCVRGIKFRRNYGKSAALNVGFEEAKGEVIITMDADLQDSPEEIPGLRDMLLSENLHIVSGWKKKRFDNTITKNLPSKLFNYTNRILSGVKLHRYIPVLAKGAGFGRIGEKVVEHKARKYGRSKFGFERFINGFLDLLTILFMSRFGKKPMHIFGVFGTLSFLLGFIIAFSLLIQKLIHVVDGTTAPLVADSAFFYIGLVAMILGTQLFLAGFIGELISRMHPDRNLYSIAETTAKS